jgi:hypothetical protein
MNSPWDSMNFGAGLPPWGYINVRNPPYNATGNGVSDDTRAIQEALNDAGKLGGGIVFLPQGNYLIQTHLVVPANTVLKGVASHVTQVRQDQANFSYLSSFSFRKFSY